LILVLEIAAGVVLGFVILANLAEIIEAAATVIGVLLLIGIALAVIYFGQALWGSVIGASREEILQFLAGTCVAVGGISAYLASAAGNAILLIEVFPKLRGKSLFDSRALGVAFVLEWFQLVGLAIVIAIIVASIPNLAAWDDKNEAVIWIGTLLFAQWPWPIVLWLRKRKSADMTGRSVSLGGELSS
jgi:hypothetical protein